MKRYISLFITALILLTSCAGKTANPIMVAQYGDEQKSCEALKYEMITLQGNMNAVLSKTDKTGKNVALGVAGAFFFSTLALYGFL